jgi:hypothetical protein
MKVVIAGSRKITDAKHLEKVIQDSGYTITEVVCGEAVGVDKLGRAWAESKNIPIRSFPANWKLGPSAGHKRNAEMASYADAAIIVWDGVSKGSQSMIKQMRRVKKPSFIWVATISAYIREKNA